MPLLNFLYKDERLISSLYAQVFQGRLQHVVQEQGSSSRSAGELGVGGKIPFLGVTASAKGGVDSNMMERWQEQIEPHDSATLDLLNHLQKYAKMDAENSKHGDILHIQGRMLLFPFASYSFLVEYGFSGNKDKFDAALKQSGVTEKNWRNSMLELQKKTCKGSPDETRFLFQARHVSPLWFRGVLHNPYLMDNADTLALTYGDNFIPVTLIGIREGISGSSQPDVLPPGGLSFAAGLSGGIRQSQDLLMSGVTFEASIRPIVIAQEVNAEAISAE